MKRYLLLILSLCSLLMVRSSQLAAAETIVCDDIRQEYYTQDNDWYITLKSDRYWLIYDIITTTLEDGQTYTLAEMIADETLLQDYEGGKHTYKAVAATYTQYHDAAGELHVSATMTVAIDGVQTEMAATYGPEECLPDETIAPYVLSYDTLETRMLDYRELMGFVQFAGINADGYEVSVCYYADEIAGDHTGARVYDKFCYLQTPEDTDRHLFCAVDAVVTATDTTGGYLCEIDGITLLGEQVHALIPFRPQPKVDPYNGDSSYREETLIMEDVDITDDTQLMGQLKVFGYTDDMLRSATLILNTDHLAGSYGTEAFNAYETFVAYVDEADMWQATAFYDFSDCTATITVDGRAFTLEADLLTYAETNYNEQVLFHILMTGTLPLGLKYDAEEAVEAQLPYLSLGTDYVESENAIQLTATDGEEAYAFLVLYVEALDEQTVLPLGEYTISRAQLPGTALSSLGMIGENPQASFYCTMYDGSIVTPMWFLQSGTVLVEETDGQLAVTVHALNSCDMPVTLYCGAAEPQDIVSIEQSTTPVCKRLHEGRLLIERAGQMYDVVGARLR